MEEIFVPLKIISAFVALTGYIAVKKGNPLFSVVHEEPLPLILNILMLRCDKRCPVMRSKIMPIEDAETSTTFVSTRSFSFPS